MKHAIVTGANRGIGLEFVKQLLARGDAVIAAVRDPENARDLQALKTSDKLSILPCNVADDNSVTAFVKQVGDVPVALLINNAGVMVRTHSAERVDFQSVLDTFNTNAVGSLRLTLALRRNLQLAKGARVAHISSGLGSLTDNTSGGYYAYRMSKAAMNMAVRSLAIDLADDDILNLALNPGWVQTDMGGMGAPTTPRESVAGMLQQIDSATANENGAFLHFRGGAFPW